MKRLFIFATLAICFIASAAPKKNNTETFSNEFEIKISNQWGLDALNIPKSLQNHSAESLGLISANIPLHSDLATNTSHEQHWVSHSDKDNKYRLITIKNTQLNSEMNSLNLIYNNGRFSAETGVSSYSKNLLFSDEFYVKGAYSLFTNQHLNISFTAKVETLNENSLNQYYGDNRRLNNISIFEQQATNTTLGIVSTYSITNNWKVLGMISSTTLDNKIEKSPLIEDKNIHMALIGTSYSF